MRDTNGTRRARTAPADPASQDPAPAGNPTATSQAGPWAMVPIWVLTMGLTGGEVAVYVSLRSFCDRNGNCYPTARTIAGRAGCSTSAVRNAVQKFRRLNILTTTEVYRPGTSELAHLRYHLVDLDPRRWTVEPREVSLDEGTGVTQPSDTSHLAEVGVSLSQVTQEHTSEQTKEHPTQSDSSLRSSSSSRNKVAGTMRMRRRKNENVEEKISNRKQGEWNRALRALVARLGIDETNAAATLDHLYDVTYERGGHITNAENFVSGIPAEELAGYHAEAKYTFLPARRDTATLINQMAEWPRPPTRQQYRDLDAKLLRVFQDGATMDTVVDALNGAPRHSYPDVAAACLATLDDLLRSPAA